MSDVEDEIILPGENIYDHLPKISFISYGFPIIVSSAIFFLALNYKVKRITINSDGRQDDSWKWRNLFVSWLHALIVGTLDLASFYYYPELTTDLISFNNLFIYTLVAFSTGYFYYDLIDIAINKKIGIMWEVVPHHLAVIIVFTYNVVVSRYIPYTNVALLAEVNSIFLHARKLLQMHKCPFNHWLYRLNSLMNLFTFLSCRFVAIVWIFYGMLFYKVSLGADYLCLLWPSMFVMLIINVMLFWRLLRNDVIRPYFGRGKSKRKAVNGVNALDSKLTHTPSSSLSALLSSVESLSSSSSSAKSSFTSLSKPHDNGLHKKDDDVYVKDDDDDEGYFNGYGKDERHDNDYVNGYDNDSKKDVGMDCDKDVDDDIPMKNGSFIVNGDRKNKVINGSIRNDNTKDHHNHDHDHHQECDYSKRINKNIYNKNNDNNNDDDNNNNDNIKDNLKFRKSNINNNAKYIMNNINNNINEDDDDDCSKNLTNGFSGDGHFFESMNKNKNEYNKHL